MMKKSWMAALLLSSAVLVTACGAGAPQNGSGTENSGTVKIEGAVPDAEQETTETETEGKTTEKAAEKAQSGGISKVITINKSFGDGQKVTHVALQYEKAIDADSLSTDSYEVKNRTVTAVRTNSEAAPAEASVPGNYVILELEIQSPLLDDKYASDGRMEHDEVIDTATVVQIKDVKSTDGEVYPAGSQEYSTPANEGIMGNDSKLYPVRDRFEDNHFYTDPEWKTVLHYNIFKPEGYEDSGETYPLLLFMPDAGSVSSDWEKVLAQGNGGTVWAEEEWQAEHPCFVVTMIYDDKFINDYWEYYDNYVEGTMNLVRSLADQYPVDKDRIYTTGQSMGCMCSLIMMSKEPDLFAGAYCVAGKWEPESLKGLKDSHILILNSEDDSLETGLLMDETVSLWEREGAAVARGAIEGIAEPQVLEAEMDKLLSENADIYYCKIQSGTGSMDLEGNPLNGSHRMTWRLGYDLPGVKEWLFTQSK